MTTKKMRFTGQRLLPRKRCLLLLQHWTSPAAILVKLIVAKLIVVSRVSGQMGWKLAMGI